MTIATVLHFSDIHTDANMQDLEAIVDLANSTKPDVAASSGNLVDGKIILEMFGKAENEILNFNEDQIKVFSEYGQVYSTVKEIGEEKIKTQLKNPKVSKEERNLFESYFKKKETIDKTIEEITEKAERKREEITKAIMPDLVRYISKIDKGLGKIKCPLLGVRGNHDPDLVYKIMKNMTYLEKTPVKIKGLVFAGAPNTNEILRGLPQELYKGLGEDEFIEDIEKFIQEVGTEEDLKQYKSNNKVYSKLKKQLKSTKADVLVTHKGLDSFAGSAGYGAGLALWLKEETATGDSLISLCGHMHGKPFYSNEHGYEGLRAGAEDPGKKESGVARAYVLHIDTKTKKIVEIDVYKKVYEMADPSNN